MVNSISAKTIKSAAPPATFQSLLSGVGVALVATGLTLVASGAPVQAASMTGDTLMYTLGGSDNFGSDEAQVKFTLEDLGDDLKFTLSVEPEVEAGTSNIADLRGFFFNISDESLLGGLSIASSTLNEGSITTTEFGPADSVINLGGGVNLNGDGNVPYDVGLAFGTPGIGSDDVRDVEFVLSHTSANLGLELLAGELIGARLTSTGPEDSGRNGSSKIKAEFPNLPTDPEPPASVPEPGTVASLFLVLGSLVAVRRRQAR